MWCEIGDEAASPWWIWAILYRGRAATFPEIPFILHDQRPTPSPISARDNSLSSRPTLACRVRDPYPIVHGLQQPEWNSATEARGSIRTQGAHFTMTSIRDSHCGGRRKRPGQGQLHARWSDRPTHRSARRYWSGPGHFGTRPECCDTSPEGHVLARNRTWSSTFARSCARPSHPEDNDRNRPAAESPTRESNPALRLRRPPCVRHTRGERAECPRQESNLVFDLRGVACRPSHAKGAVEADGRTRTGMNLLTRQGPHRSATSAGAGGARI